MKILLITDLYPVMPDEVTTPKTLLNFVKEWEKSGHSVKVIKPNFLFNSFVRGKKYYKTGWYGNVFNANYFLPFVGNIKNKLREFYAVNFKPDVIIAHMPSGILFANNLGLPFVAGIHCSDIEVLTKPLYSIYFRGELSKALKNASCISCRSFVLKSKLLTSFPEFEQKCFVAPSGVEESFIVNNEKCLNPAQKFKVVTCANFKKRKNIDKVILALKGLDNFELTVVGDGSIKKKLEKLDTKVKFLGRLSCENVLKVMREHDIFILPSVGETFGMVYLEAMASGCITVCSKNEAVDGIIKNGENGFTVNPDVNEIRDFFKSLSFLSEETLIKIRQNSIETVKKYTQVACAKNYLDNVTSVFKK